MVVPLKTQVDLERSRRLARAQAQSIGFNAVDAESIVLAVSELGSNALRYAIQGRLTISFVADATRCGIAIAYDDQGPGIADLDAAMRDGFSTGGGLGSGLGSIRRLMDDCEVQSSPAGTRIMARKWLPKSAR